MARKKKRKLSLMTPINFVFNLLWTLIEYIITKLAKFIWKLLIIMGLVITALMGIMVQVLYADDIISGLKITIKSSYKKRKGK